VSARYKGKPAEEALSFAVACGAESTQHLGAGVIDPDRVGRLRSEITVERPELGAPVRPHS
jgi:1-phosphofructokinase/tagatose 6-phosphate kinase